MTAPIDLANLTDASYAQLYEQRIRPCFRGHEGERVDAVATFKQRIAIGAGIVLAAAAAVYFFARDGGWTAMVLMVGGLFAYMIAYAPLAMLGKKLKRAYCAAIAEAMGASFIVDVVFPPAFDRLQRLRLVPHHDRSSFEDQFSGAYKDCPFELYEGTLKQRRTGSKGRTRWVTVFQGQLIRMHFPREFLGITIVRRDAGMFNAFGGGLGLERVRLEDPVFEKAFEVWGNDQVEARYILHPVLMQRLLDLETSLKGRRLRCAFEQGDLLVAVEGGNLFEPGDLFRPLDDPARARRIVNDISSIVRVMDQVQGAQARRPPRPS